MEIKIDDNKTISEVQAEFSKHFPFLKLEFYKTEHQEGQGSTEKERIASNRTIGEVRSNHESGGLSIHGNQKVSTLESAFHDVYGLNVQVFRKSADVWLQTIKTDEWTLSEQNHTGEEHKI
ncbi:MAG: hypothetical protein R2813_02235 [Flavobacteriales bacterium]